ncbi:hypothetical protein FEM48_Zijuj03G0024400 [Ziziphus jujuba var. spinosa]|uniref:Peptide N-acetyl-beta-D-glucosaminyl asparaginase amidase A N-terminal domain-containing protein n=1 Tax=Ziziphus jujuba var. spinosa TaxID=714518 RepID=A0A978VMM0_ZIZJJ|nr:hypothetical protein FEM48_Zijuj03G0024400 [Ziziphus jujuba var. spinosa]
MDSFAFPLLLLLFFFSLLLHQLPFSTANFHKLNHLRPHFLAHQTPTTNDTPPTRFFEVTKPINLPKTKPCSHLVLHHDFGFTYGKPPVLANYTPPSHCSSHKKISKIVLEWKATCKGKQFDRIFGIWLGGVELLRSCTAEPRATGIVWSVEKDITRYYPLLLKNQTLAVYLGNLLDSTYTGIYHVDLTIYFYPAEEHFNNHVQKKGKKLVTGYNSWADLILPISRKLPLNDGLWFKLENASYTPLNEFKIPKNVYRAVLEVYVSFHENDEFWYSNYPNEYIAANNLTDTPGNGPFREVTVSLDGETVGAIWPFTVIYTGGVNPLLWRPITAIGSYNLPSYDIEITPFLEKILDGKIHNIGFHVTNALNVWYIDANLHLWLDKKSEKTEGKLLKHTTLPLAVSLNYKFNGLDGKFSTSVSRSVLSTGWVRSSYGNITTKHVQDFSYRNLMVMKSNGSEQMVNQVIHFNDLVQAKIPSEHLHSKKSDKIFSLFLYSNYLSQENGTVLSAANLTLGFNEKSRNNADFGFSKSKTSLKNLQSGQGYIVIKNNVLAGGLGSTQQVYKYAGDGLCYSRDISSSNYTILYDKVRNTCKKRKQSSLDLVDNKGV